MERTTQVLLPVVEPVAMTYAKKSKDWLPRHNPRFAERSEKMLPSTVLRR